MEERLAAEDAKVAVAVTLGVVENAVHTLEVDVLPGRLHVDPTSLATELATVDDRDEEEGREVLATRQPLLVQLDRAHSLVAEAVNKLAQEPRIRLGQ
jgi:hypothetical protein